VSAGGGLSKGGGMNYTPREFAKARQNHERLQQQELARQMRGIDLTDAYGLARMRHEQEHGHGPQWGDPASRGVVFDEPMHETSATRIVVTRVAEPACMNDAWMEESAQRAAELERSCVEPARPRWRFDAPDVRSWIFPVICLAMIAGGVWCLL
jgi:hypothetical protein